MSKAFQSGKIPFRLTLFCSLSGIPILFLSDHNAPSAGVLLLLCLLAALLLPFGRDGLIAGIIILSVFCLFQIRLYRSGREYLPFPEDDICGMEGVLAADPHWRDSDTMILKIRLKRCVNSRGISGRAEGEISYRLKTSSCTAEVGRLVRSDPVMMEGPGFSLYRKDRRLYASGGRFSGGDATGPDARRGSFLFWMQSKCSLLSPTAEILLPALLAGLDHPGKERIHQIFRESGTAHIMALSGFHAGLIGVALFILGRIFFGFRGGCLFSLAGLVGYLWLAGFTPSLTRAVVMYGLFIAARLFHSRFSPVAVLLCSYYLTALMFPSAPHTLSSQLSYLALGGILLTARRLNIMAEPYIPRWIRLPLAVSLGAQLWTAAVVLRTFGILYPAGLAASLVLTPLVTFYVYAGVLWLILPAGTVTVRLFSLLLGGMETLILRGAEFFASFPSVKSGQTGAGPFLLFLIPVLLLEFYRPGRLYGKGKTGFKLRFGFRNQNPAGDDGAGTPQTVGTEFPDKPGCQREDHLPSGYSGG